MRIAINALAVDGGGGQTYLENLLPELNRLDKENHYFVLLRKPHTVKLPSPSPRFSVLTFSIPRPFWISRFAIEQLLLPFWLKSNKIDLLYSPADATTLRAPCPVVLAMRNPNLYVDGGIDWSFRFRMKFKILGWLAKLSSAKASQVIFVSNASEKLVRRKILIPSDKTTVIHHGVSSIFLKKGEPSARIARILKDKKPYILSISSVYRYKNYIRLIEAFRQIRSKLPDAFHLVIIGSSFDMAYCDKMLNRIKELGLSEHVHYLAGLSLSELPPIYQGAELFAFPSFLETFGHTLVEAMASGIPIAAADIEPTREIADGAARYFDPFDVDSIASALLETLRNESLRSELVKNGGTQIAKFSWIRCAEQTLTIFQKAIRSSASSARAKTISLPPREEKRAER